MVLVMYGTVDGPDAARSESDDAFDGEEGHLGVVSIETRPCGCAVLCWKKLSHSLFTASAVNFVESPEFDWSAESVTDRSAQQASSNATLRFY